uniref:Isoamyl acetate-hydrolyzing esterase 1 homolog n=1 Tax=Leptobrachium leishanense TaxID=445787 RepID=A0A8C5PYM8_9ANUR
MISWPRVILFGDSITQFAFEANAWGSVIANKLVRKCDVINRGLSGYNTRWAKLILPSLISPGCNAGNTLAVTIFFGANDSSLKEENPQQHVPLEEYADNIRCMIQYLKSISISGDKIILITPPPLHEPDWEKQCHSKGCKLNRSNAVAGAYAKACVQVASECGTDVLDLWSQMQEGSQDFTVYLSSLVDLGGKAGVSPLHPALLERCEQFKPRSLIAPRHTNQILGPQQGALY